MPLSTSIIVEGYDSSASITTEGYVSTGSVIVPVELDLTALSQEDTIVNSIYEPVIDTPLKASRQRIHNNTRLI